MAVMGVRMREGLVGPLCLLKAEVSQTLHGLGPDRAIAGQADGPHNAGTGVERGDLHVSFDLVFPKHVPAEHKAALRRILS